jgi:hypothetical protein
VRAVESVDLLSVTDERIRAAAQRLAASKTRCTRGSLRSEIAWTGRFGFVVEAPVRRSAVRLLSTTIVPLSYRKSGNS